VKASKPSCIVLDSSAVLAHVLGEPGGARVKALLLAQEIPVAISAVNWSEVLSRLQRNSPIMDSGRLSAMLPGVEIVIFGRREAEDTAEMGKQCAPLSLGDRACLALAADRKATAWTTDKIWTRMNTGVDLEVLR
jgi:ribonuclease VapC